MEYKDDDEGTYIDEASHVSALDLYEDLLVKDTNQGQYLSIQEVNLEKQQLQEQNQLLLQQLSQATISLRDKTEQIQTLKGNLSSLLQTAKMEIERKDKVINRLKSEANERVPWLHSRRRVREENEKLKRKSMKSVSLKGERVDNGFKSLVKPDKMQKESCSTPEEAVKQHLDISPTMPATQSLKNISNSTDFNNDHQPDRKNDSYHKDTNISNDKKDIKNLTTCEPKARRSLKEVATFQSQQNICENKSMRSQLHKKTSLTKEDVEIRKRAHPAVGSKDIVANHRKQSGKLTEDATQRKHPAMHHDSSMIERIQERSLEKQKQHRKCAYDTEISKSHTEYQEGVHRSQRNAHQSDYGFRNTHEKRRDSRYSRHDHRSRHERRRHEKSNTSSEDRDEKSSARRYQERHHSKASHHSPSAKCRLTEQDNHQPYEHSVSKTPSSKSKERYPEKHRSLKSPIRFPGSVTGSSEKTNNHSIPSKNATNSESYLKKDYSDTLHSRGTLKRKADSSTDASCTKVKKPLFVAGYNSNPHHVRNKSKEKKSHTISEVRTTVRSVKEADGLLKALSSKVCDNLGSDAQSKLEGRQQESCQNPADLNLNPVNASTSHNIGSNASVKVDLHKEVPIVVSLDPEKEFCSISKENALNSIHRCDGLSLYPDVYDQLDYDEDSIQARFHHMSEGGLLQNDRKIINSECLETSTFKGSTKDGSDMKRFDSVKPKESAKITDVCKHTDASNKALHEDLCTTKHLNLISLPQSYADTKVSEPSLSVVLATLQGDSTKCDPYSLKGHDVMHSSVNTLNDKPVPSIECSHIKSHGNLTEQSVDITRKPGMLKKTDDDAGADGKSHVLSDHAKAGDTFNISNTLEMDIGSEVVVETSSQPALCPTEVDMNYDKTSTAHFEDKTFAVNVPLAPSSKAGTAPCTKSQSSYALRETGEVESPQLALLPSNSIKLISNNSSDKRKNSQSAESPIQSVTIITTKVSSRPSPVPDKAADYFTVTKECSSDKSHFDKSPAKNVDTSHTITKPGTSHTQGKKVATRKRKGKSQKHQNIVTLPSEKTTLFQPQDRSDSKTTFNPVVNSKIQSSDTKQTDIDTTITTASPSHSKLKSVKKKSPNVAKLNNTKLVSKLSANTLVSTNSCMASKLNLPGSEKVINSMSSEPKKNKVDAETKSKKMRQVSDSETKLKVSNNNCFEISDNEQVLSLPEKVPERQMFTSLRECVKPHTHELTNTSQKPVVTPNEGKGLQGIPLLTSSKQGIKKKKRVKFNRRKSHKLSDDSAESSEEKRSGLEEIVKFSIVVNEPESDETTKQGSSLSSFEQVPNEPSSTFDPPQSFLLHYRNAALQYLLHFAKQALAKHKSAPDQVFTTKSNPIPSVAAKMCSASDHSEALLLPLKERKPSSSQDLSSSNKQHTDNLATVKRLNQLDKPESVAVLESRQKWITSLEECQHRRKLRSRWLSERSDEESPKEVSIALNSAKHTPAQPAISSATIPTADLISATSSSCSLGFNEESLQNFLNLPSTFKVLTPLSSSRMSDDTSQHDVQLRRVYQKVMRSPKKTS